MHLHRLLSALRNRLALCLFACNCALAAPVDLSSVPRVESPSALGSGWQHGAFMEIFVRGYQDSDGDGIGDLRGLTRRLDYLKELGIKGIWLMPITTSADRDHGYATTDFRAIEPAYGTLADFDEFLKQAHRRGIGVIIDYVLNHSAKQHPLFESSARSPDSPYRDWYVWQDLAPSGWNIWGNNPWFTTSNGAYYGTFGPHMPDFNLRNPSVVDYHMSSLRFWLNRGLDGFRLDAVPHLIENDATHWNDQPESRQLTHQFAALIHSYARRHVVCEATANPKVYAAPEICGSAFAFGHEADIIKAAQGDARAVHAVAAYFVTAPLSMATMLANHDIFAGARVWDQLHGNISQYKLAAATYLLQPGTPFIYYGEEVGMAGVQGLPGDAPLRAPMSWSADISGFTSGEAFRPLAPNAASQNASAQVRDGHSLLAFYKTMLKLRNNLPSIAQGSYEAAFVDGHVMGFQRRFGHESSMVLINYGLDARRVKLSNLPPHMRLLPHYPRAAAPARRGAHGLVVLLMPPQSVRVFTFQH